MNLFNKYSIKIAFILQFICMISFLNCSILKCSAFNNKTTIITNTLLSNNKIIKIDEYKSKAKYIDIPDICEFYIGSENPYIHLKLLLDDETVEWEGMGDPISITEKNGNLYLAVLSRFNTFKLFKYYKNNKWVEIGRNNFPKNIFQNLWLYRDGCVENLDNIDNCSYTVLLWNYLENGTQFNSCVEYSFISLYIKKYIDKTKYANPCNVYFKNLINK